MKLIEILVRELPKRGGWPIGIDKLVQNSIGCVYQAGGGPPLWRFVLAQDWELAEISRGEYYIALDASKEMLVNKAWDGQGLPPVGQRCDFYSALEGRWLPVQIEAVTKDGVAFTWLTDELSYSGLDCVRTENALFRAPLSAEEMARIGIIDNFIKIMAGYIEGGLKPEIIRERLYEHLPLLPGVRVESQDED